MKKLRQINLDLIVRVGSVAQFLWYLWVAKSHDITSSTKTNLKELVFLLKLKTHTLKKLHHHQKAKKIKTYTPRKLALTNLNDSTLCLK